MSAGETVRALVRGAVGATGIGQAVESFRLTDAACLTFDDGPDPVQTDKVLGALSETGDRATFFVMANRVRRHPELLREVRDAGHEIGLHGPDHRDLSACSPLRVRSLLLDAKSLVEDELGASIRWFRPPYVALRADGWLALRRGGLDFVASGSAIRDWEADLDDVRRIELFRDELTPGDVVLAHDSWADVSDNAYPGPEPAVDRAWLCRQALGAFAERGLRALTLSQASAEAPTERAFRVALRPGRG